MKDLHFFNKNINLKEKASENELLAGQLSVFCATNINEIPNLVEYGLDKELLRADIPDKIKRNHIRSKINKFFGKRITKISDIKIENKGREMKWSLSYISIYNNELQTQQGGVT